MSAHSFVAQLPFVQASIAHGGWWGAWMPDNLQETVQGAPSAVPCGLPDCNSSHRALEPLPSTHAILFG